MAVWEIETLGLHSPHPETRGPYAILVDGRNEATLRFGNVSVAVLPSRKGLLQYVRILVLHSARRPKDFELRIEAEKCLQQVLLRPEPQVFQHRFPRIIEWQKNIMHVDDNSRPERR